MRFRQDSFKLTLSKFHFFESKSEPRISTCIGDTGAKRTYGAMWSPGVVTYLLTPLELNSSIREALTLCYYFVDVM